MPGICHTRISHEDEPQEKIYVAIKEDDGSISEFKIEPSQFDGKTEEELNAAIDTFLSYHYGADWAETFTTGGAGVHLNRDGEPVFWTGSPPDVWPEDEPEF